MASPIAADLAGPHELVQHEGILRRRREAARRDDPEPGLAVLDRRDEAEVVDGGLRAVRRAAAERDLELARERRGEGVTEELPRDGLGVGRHVERRAVADLGALAGGHGTHRVAASVARREPGLVEATHRGLDVGHLHEVELDVLARRHVTERA